MWTNVRFVSKILTTQTQTHTQDPQQQCWAQISLIGKHIHDYNKNTIHSIDNKTNTHISHVSIRFWAAICDWIATASPHPAPFPVTFNVCTASRSEYTSGLHTAHSQIHKGKGHDWSLLSISVCSFRNGKWRGFHVVLKTYVFRRHNRWNNIDAIGCKGGCTQMVEQYCPPEVLWRGSGELCNLPWPHHRVTFKRRWVLFL